MSSTARGAWLAVVGWLAASALLTAAQVLRADGPSGDLSYLAVAGGAAVAAWLGASRLRGTDQLVGALLAAGVTATGLGDFISIAIGWRTGAEPEASLADVAWLASYVGLGAGLLRILRRGGGERRDIDGLIDVAAVFVAGMMVVWQLAVAATVADATLPVGIRVLWGLYPVLDVALLALAVRVIIRYRTVASLLITGGVLLWLASDLAYLAIADAASYAAVLDLGWLGAMVLFALAVIYGPTAPPRLGVGRRRNAAIDEVGLGQILVALLPLLVPGLVDLVGHVRGPSPNPAVLVPGSVILVALAFARMARLAWAAKWARRALASQQRYALALAANSSDAVVVVDADLRLVDNSPQLAALVGYPGTDVTGYDVLNLVVPEDLEEAQAAVRRCLASPGQVFELELRIRHGEGREIWLGARVVNLLHDPDVRGVVVNLRDVSDRKNTEQELAHQAFHDALTGLANRALFRDRLDHALERTATTGAGPAVIFLDLDAFKTVNDSLGHDAGDDLLQEVAVRLTAAVRRGDTVGRLGGDEFAILIEQSDHPVEDTTEVANRVLRALRHPVRLGSQSILVSASLGIAVAEDGSGATSLLRDADVAMYRAKATGKGKWTVYQPGMRTAAVERLQLETGMHAALERGEFGLVYQPIVELATERVVGFEALLRWHHPAYGTIEADRFVPLAEETGFIILIGRWVLAEATRTAAHWRDRFPGLDLTMAVNISARQLAATELVPDVTDALAGSGLDASHLILEMTETVLVHDPAAAAARLHELGRQGVRLAIDDFGTGYSSLSYLRQFPVDVLKIDRTFVSTITDREENPAILRGLIELGHTLNLTTLAEGVELKLQRDRLRAVHCDLAQGFLFGRPMPRTEAERLLVAAREADAARSSGAGR